MEFSDEVLAAIQLAYSEGGNRELAEMLIESQGLKQQYQQAKDYFAQDKENIIWACACVLDSLPPHSLTQDWYLYAYFQGQKCINIYMKKSQLNCINPEQSILRLENLLKGKLKLLSVGLYWNGLQATIPAISGKINYK